MVSLFPHSSVPYTHREAFYPLLRSSSPGSPLMTSRPLTAGTWTRAMRMPVSAFQLLHQLKPRRPRRGILPEVRAAIALRYLGGGSYAALGVHSAAVYRALWEVLDAVNAAPSLDLDFQLENRTRRLSQCSEYVSRHRHASTPVGKPTCIF